MNERLLIILFGGFVSGIAFGSLISPSLPVVAFLLLISLGLAIIWRRSLLAQGSQYVLLTSCFILTFSLGLLRVDRFDDQFGHSELVQFVGSEITLQGVISKEPDIRERTQQLYLDTGEDTILVTTDRLTSVSYGDFVSVTGTLKTPEPFVTDLGRAFDYPRYLQVRGVEYQVSFAEVTVLESGQGNRIVSWLLILKHFFVSAVQRAIMEPAAGLGVGLLLGVNQGLGEDLETAFRRSGIIHIVVLSGYNVMLIVSFVMAIGSLFLSPRPRMMFGVIAIVAFALIVGLSATVVRASIMAGLLLMAQAFGKSYQILRGLFVAGLVMILTNPYLLLFDIGFQLSFMATLGLLLIAPRFELLAATVPARLGMREFLIATVATQIAVLPLLLYHIGEISVISIVANVLVLPMVPLAMFLTFITGITELLLPILTPIIAAITSVSLWYIMAIAEFLASLPLATISVPAFHPALIGVLYGTVGMSFCWWKQRQIVQQSSLTGWVIEEESEEEKTGEAESPAPVPRTIPILFR